MPSRCPISLFVSPLGDECRDLALSLGQGGRRRTVARLEAEEFPDFCDKRVDVRCLGCATGREEPAAGHRGCARR
jgi:hypothetical protein